MPATAPGSAFTVCPAGQGVHISVGQLAAEVNAELNAARAQALSTLADDLQQIAKSCAESLVATPPECVAEAAGHRTRRDAFTAAAQYARYTAAGWATK